jgi:hypothetical protein
MARYRMYPTAAHVAVLLEHCAQARYVWNLAWNLHQFGQLETYGKGLTGGLAAAGGMRTRGSGSSTLNSPEMSGG